MRSTKLSTIAADLSAFADGIEANIPKLINKAAVKAVELATETVLGSPSDESTANTVYGIKKAVADILGTEDDTEENGTVWGLKNAAEAAADTATTAKETVETILNNLNTELDSIIAIQNSLIGGDA